MAVVPAFCDALMAGRHPKIYGDGGASREFTFVRDCVEANLLAGFGTVIQTNLIATPPLNTATDAPPANADSTFYRVQLEP